MENKSRLKQEMENNLFFSERRTMPQDRLKVSLPNMIDMIEKAIEQSEESFEEVRREHLRVQSSIYAVLSACNEYMLCINGHTTAKVNLTEDGFTIYG